MARNPYLRTSPMSKSFKPTRGGLNGTTAMKLISFTGSIFYVGNQSLTFESALNHCQLARPDLFAIDDKIEGNLQGLNLGDDKYWLGYYETYEAFQYYGMINYSTPYY